MNRPLKFMVGGGVMFFMGILIGWVAFPPLLKSQIFKATKLTERGERRPLWQKLPFSLDFKVYLFNVTNAAEVENGAKPIVKEVGPYFFEEWKEKVDLVDHDEDDTIEFNTKTTFYFRANMSEGLTGEEELTLPHILVLGIVLTAVKDKPKLIGLVGKAVDSVFDKPSSVFMKVKPRELLFDGIPIDCSNVKDVPGKGVCTILKTEAKQNLMDDGNNKYRFSLFGNRNATISSERWRVKRGIENIFEVGTLVEYDGQPQLSVWADGRCNDINGTDGTIFPPLLKEEFVIRVFSADLCRVVEIRHEYPSKVKGIKTGHYSSNLGDIPNTPEDQCFCKRPDACLKKGALDLTNCMGAPIIATLPHFYLADESYLNSVEGCTPDKEKHEIFIDFDLLTATPIHARTRMQFNMELLPVEKFKLMNNFPEAMLPVFWIEEGVLIPKFLRSQVKLAHNLILVVTIMKWMMLIGGIGMCIFGGVLKYKGNKKSQKLEITKVTPQNMSREATGEQKKWPLDANALHAAAVPPNLDRN